MKSALACLVIVAVSILLASCSDDPLAPGGTYTPPEYHGTLQSLRTDFTNVCGTSNGDILAIGSGVTLRYDGSTWAPTTPPGMNWLHYAQAFAPGEMVISDGREVAILKDGKWSRIERVPSWSNAFWARSPNDLYAATYDAVYRHTGSSWEPMPVNKPGEIYSIGGDAGGHVVLSGWSGRIDRFDGTTWTSGYLDSTQSYGTLAVTPAGRIFVSNSDRIYEITGATSTQILSGEIYDPILCADGETLYAAGHSPYEYGVFRIAEYKSNNWRAVAQERGPMQDFAAVDGRLVCTGYSNFIWQGTPAGGDVVEVAASRGTLLDAVAIGDAIYAVGDGAYRYADGRWENLDKEYITREAALGINGLRENDIYAVGGEMILHYDGAQWTWVNAGLGAWLSAVWVEPNGHVVAVGDNTIVTFDGTTWIKRVIPLGGYTFSDVTGFGATVFMVGSWGVVGIRRDGEYYISRPVDFHLYGVWGTDEKHVYAVGDANQLCFYDGEHWETRTIEGPDLPGMRSIWGTSAANIFVLDDNGTLAHFDGREWLEQERLFGSNMRAVAGTARDVLVVGTYGSAMYRR